MLHEIVWLLLDDPVNHVFRLDVSRRLMLTSLLLEVVDEVLLLIKVVGVCLALRIALLHHLIHIVERVAALRRVSILTTVFHNYLNNKYNNSYYEEKIKVVEIALKVLLARKKAPPTQAPPGARL